MICRLYLSLPALTTGVINGDNGPINYTNNTAAEPSDQSCYQGQRYTDRTVNTLYKFILAAEDSDLNQSGSINIIGSVRGKIYWSG